MEPACMKSDSREPSYVVAWNSSWPLYRRLAFTIKDVFYQFISEVMEGPRFEEPRMTLQSEEVYDILNMDVAGYQSSSDLEFVETPKAKHREPTLAVAEHNPEALEIDSNYVSISSMKPVEA